MPRRAAKNHRREVQPDAVYNNRLVTQLINRLQNERDQRQQLAHQLEVRDAELKRARQQLHEMKKKVDEMLSQFRDAGSAS